MQIIFEDVESGVGPFDRVVVATGADSYGAPDAVMLEGADRVFLQPAQVRELAAALLRAADEAEEVPSRLDTVQVALKNYASTAVGSIDYYEAAVAVADLVGKWFPPDH